MIPWENKSDIGELNDQLMIKTHCRLKKIARNDVKLSLVQSVVDQSKKIWFLESRLGECNNEC